jgi:hypothetical protein
MRSLVIRVWRRGPFQQFRGFSRTFSAADGGTSTPRKKQPLAVINALGWPARVAAAGASGALPGGLGLNAGQRAAPRLLIGAKKQLVGPNEQDGMQPVV